jgi:hypothetical protein
MRNEKQNGELIEKAGNEAGSVKNTLHLFPFAFLFVFPERINLSEINRIFQE